MTTPATESRADIRAKLRQGDVARAMRMLDDIKPDETQANRIFIALQALELVACDCPWPADAVQTRHFGMCAAGRILDKALGVRFVDLMHRGRR